MLGILTWGIASALFCGLIAAALNLWLSKWHFRLRVLAALLASLLPTVAAVCFVLGSPSNFGLLLSMSPDEFLIPFVIQIVVVLILAVPTAWLISSRAVRERPSIETFE